MRRLELLSAGLVVNDILAWPVDEGVFTRDSTNLERVTFTTGGDALNVAIGAARLGRRVSLAGRTGCDWAGESIRAAAQNERVDISLLDRDDEAATATSVVLCSPAGERHFAYYPGANLRYAASALTDEVLSQTQILFVGSMMALPGLDGDVLASLFRRAQRQGVCTAMDTTWDSDGIWMPRIRAALPYTDLFVPSHYEAAKLTGTDEPDEMLRVLKEEGVRIPGVKCGAKGVRFENLILPAFDCPDDEKVDTTGAGDAFMAGILSGLALGRNLRDSALIGSACSNFCIRKLGATTGAPSLVEVDALIGRAFV